MISRLTGLRSPHVMQIACAFAIAIAVLQTTAASPSTQSGAFCAPGQAPQFVLGFAFLKGQIGSIMGDPVDCEHYDASGNAFQTTTTGSLFYNMTTNIPEFTSSASTQHWAWTARGLVTWSGPSLDPPAAAQLPSGFISQAQASSGASSVDANAQAMVDAGRQTFRFDSFGSEAFWGATLQLHKALEGSKLGGVSPNTALSVSLKVDMDAVPASVAAQIKNGQLDLNDPANTLALLKLNAVVGVKGSLNPDGSLSSVGITCALCHSTVDDAFAPGIGHRLDGWPNRDLNVGAIVSLSPNLQPVADLLGVDVPTVLKVLGAWGPGKFDAELFLDGKAFRPDGKTAATLISPAFGLAGVNNHTWTGSWGTVTYWNAFVANLEMHGQGTFFDPRLNNPSKYPIAARAGFANVRSPNDFISAKLPALQFYQLAIPAPKPPAGSFDTAAAARGDALFSGKANCASCHVPPTYTEPGWNLHAPGDIGIDDFQANRSPDGRYRTAPLKGLWAHMKGGFYHDGRFATLTDVVAHYNDFFHLGLSSSEINDLVEYLKSL